MSEIKASVIIPTHNRPEKLAETLACLSRQQLDREFEVVVVDDGSTPPVAIEASVRRSNIKLLRTEGVERSAARNHGAAAATGTVLIFIDDDICVKPDFVAAHLRAHAEWESGLAVGAIRLPDEVMTKPFPRFRQKLEQREVPSSRGVTQNRNFCTAANMSILSETFRDLGGFDDSIYSSEDQDFALRHTQRGDRIVFLPEAEAIHHDDALDIRSYCHRVEWGSLHMNPFCDRYPDWPDNLERERVNGPARWGNESLSQSVRKVIKLCISVKPVTGGLFAIASLLERVAPNSRALDRVFRLLLGAHILRGYRKGSRLRAMKSQDTRVVSGVPSSVGSLNRRAG